MGSPVTATFSEDMEPSTITNSTFYLRTGISTNVTGTVTYNADTRTATFAPASSLAPGQSYTATITTGVKDSLGKRMASSHSWTFQTSALATYTIGGIVSNLSGTLVLQNNGGDNLTLVSSGSFTFHNSVSAGGAYSVTVLTHPSNPYQICTVTAGSGIANANVTNISVDCEDSVGPLYPNAPNWNDYVRNDGSRLFDALNTACTGTETGGYSACIHGGEVRAVQVTGETSCANLTAADALGAFNWVCVPGSPNVKMVSTGLKEDKFLSDLIDFDAVAWKPNSVTVSKSATTILTTPSGIWYANPVVTDNDGGGLYTSGTIYLVTAQPADAFAWYTYNADKVALVVKPGLVLHGMSAANFTRKHTVAAVTRKFVWFEGEITGGESGLVLDRVKFSMIRKLRVSNADNGLQVGDSWPGNESNMIMNVTASENSTGIDLWQSSYTTLVNVIAANNRGDGIRVDSTSSYNTMINVTTANNQADGINLLFANDHDIVMMNVSAVNNGPGIYYTGAYNNLLVNANAVNNYSDGILIPPPSSINNTFLNIASVHNGYLYNPNCSAYQVSVLSEPNTFLGLLKIGTPDAPCQAMLCNSSSNAAGLNASCTPTGTSTASLVTGLTATNIFVGKVVSDGTNTTNSGGIATYSYDGLDWLHFDNAYRGWGRDGSSFPAETNTGECISGEGHDTCRIWDWSMKATDVQLRGVLSLPTGSDTATHVWSASTSSDCQKILGATWNSGTSKCSTTFLRNAVEIIGDGNGNDNGLCESNETCLYTPNIGSYQGHGSLVSAGAFTDGALSGITLLRRNSNGY